MPEIHSSTPTPSSMPTRRDTEVREVVGLFSDAGALEAAVEDLLRSGFEHGDVSLLAGERVVREKLGHRLDDTIAAADDPNVPRRGYVGSEATNEGRTALTSILGYFGAVTALGVTFATGGAAAAAIGAALVGGGAGAGLGVGLGKLYDKRTADNLEEQIHKGGILVWVRCRDGACEERAGELLRRHGAHHVHAHAMPM
jgi:hypothetical protein